MTRGKYAARAAQGRADAAGIRADRAADALTAERESHAQQVTDLKARIEKLSAQLTGAVTNLAADAINRAEADCVERIRTERQHHHDTAIEAFRRLGKAIVFEPATNHWHIPADDIAFLVADLAQALGVPAGQAHDAAADGSRIATERASRRANSSRAKTAAAGTPIIAIKGRVR